ncbi:Por secretion system C-terminal sorting domain-containing protein [Hyunsoonleella jejuensis]|uniref:Por secretion system C-terminal sorting domain-containing protein n=1 Tax=Hyunsoonleella jejuensis TaxID=419940 RepID=A0A1H9KDC8_9FLAO|nr:T9SS type A sorting domain-containing protein [Hyunsoonleella jejuensis]SEQ97109.1 Por secretion system C-terminal sorting domain-containing protein [Hyunsoonleella jejuensis]
MKQFLHYSIFLLFILNSFFTFSQTYKTDTKSIFTWDTAANDWELELLEEFEFANNGNKETKITGYSMPGMELAYQNIKVYDANNNIISDELQFWNSVSNEWVENSLDEYTYDASGNLIDEVYKIYNFISMSYINSFRNLYEDYSGSDVGKQTNQQWNTSTNQWDNVEQAVYTYMAPGKPMSVLFYDWVANAWSQSERITATYDVGNNRIIETLSEEYNGSIWENSDITFFTYDSNGLETQLLTQVWNGSSWVNEDRDSSTYDSNGNKTVYTFESWNSPNPGWNFYYKEEKTFSVAAPFSLSTDYFNKTNFKVYPNPAKDVINISSKFSIENIQLFNVLGHKVLEVSKTHQLNIENLKSGVYLLKVFNDNNTATRRIVIQKS